MANVEYAELYHQYFTEFLASVDIISSIDSAYALIKSYVEKDPTAFYNYSEFETGVEALRQFCVLRTKSISSQLANDKTSESMNYADASGLTLSDMGSMGMGGGKSDIPGERGNIFEDTMPEGFNPAQKGEMPEMPEGLNPFQRPGGDLNSGTDKMEPAKGSISGWLWIAVSVLILGAGLVIVKKYK